MTTTKSVAAALVLAFSSVLEASCLRATPAPDATAPSTEQLSDAVNLTSGPDEPIEEAPEPMLHAGLEYGSEDFPFVVVRKWDGEDGAGGWQRALDRRAHV